MLSNTQKKATLLLLAKQFSVAALYLLSGSLTHHFIISNGIVSIVWLGSGLALAALLLGGRTYIWGVFFGSFALNVLTNDSIWAIGGITLADVLAALLGYKLLTRNGQSDFNLRTLSNYLQLILLGGCMASVVGALIGVLSMLLAGYITPSNFFVNFVHWWMGDVMGVVLLATLALVWKHRPLLSMKQCLEAILLLSATFIVGQIVFIGWFHDSVGLIARGYWQYFFVTLIAIRLGGCAVTIALMMIATQALIGAVNTTGLFSDDIAKTCLQ